MNYIKKLRKVKPLVHNITNYVTVNDVANAILAIGGSPIMSDEITEVAQMTSIRRSIPRCRHRHDWMESMLFCHRSDIRLDSAMDILYLIRSPAWLPQRR